MVITAKLGIVEEILEGTSRGAPEFVVRHYSPAEIGKAMESEPRYRSQFI